MSAEVIGAPGGLLLVLKSGRLRGPDLAVEDDCLRRRAGFSGSSPAGHFHYCASHERASGDGSRRAYWRALAGRTGPQTGTREERSAEPRLPFAEGDQLLARISSEIVAMLREYYGRGSTRTRLAARTQWVPPRVAQCPSRARRGPTSARPMARAPRDPPAPQLDHRTGPEQRPGEPVRRTKSESASQGTAHPPRYTRRSAVPVGGSHRRHARATDHRRAQTTGARPAMTAAALRRRRQASQRHR